MREFEKWYGEDVPDTEHDDYDWYEGSKHGWKAALEWLKERGYCDGMGFYCSYVDDIDEELTGIKADRP
jgi:hypothetical protein